MSAITPEHVQKLLSAIAVAAPTLGLPQLAAVATLLELALEILTPEQAIEPHQLAGSGERTGPAGPAPGDGDYPDDLPPSP